MVVDVVDVVDGFGLTDLRGMPEMDRKLSLELYIQKEPKIPPEVGSIVSMLKVPPTVVVIFSKLKVVSS